MRRKIMDRRGFTLAETLMVIVILSLMTAAGIAGISSVMTSRRVMVQAADADILGSTAFQAIANELRFGQNIEVEEDCVTLDSVTYGERARICLTENRLTYGDEGRPILSESTYSSGLELSELGFEENSDGSITIILTVSNGSGDLWHKELPVVPLN